MSGKKRYARPVSIIGVGQTDFTTDPELSWHELFTWAAQDAMEDAGINPRQIDQLIVPNFSMWPFMGNSTSIHVALADWIGMTGKPVQRHEEGCASGYIAIEEAAKAVASGVSDIVLICSVEMSEFGSLANQPAHMLKPINELPRFDASGTLNDPAYARFDGASNNMVFDMDMRYYASKHNLSDQTIDDILSHYAISTRRNASLNPHANQRKLYSELATEMGFDNEMDYLRSKYNPHMSHYLRVSHMSKRVNAAAAIIVCAADVADSFKQKPVEILGCGVGCYSTGVPHYMLKQTKVAIDSVLELTGIHSDELDYLQCCDMHAGEILETLELLGYLGTDGYGAILEGQTAYDGCHPINADGGYLSRGHAYAASGLANLKEVVLQMRGQAGQRQIKKQPHTALLWGWGGSHSSIATMLRTQG
ncbi:MAG: thiolase family protein [Coriobacteriales bacterium]|jgi:acetyl-CoA C-acetyltransferase|nr:thiolase family protein [Coriobacteriales bacterium]